ncbi:MAG TPA: hypothetical protein VFR87_02520 [Nocardioidaceae bacterium]|nr:hypothetical protein [Nocardioidaceae bacterium]
MRRVLAAALAAALLGGCVPASPDVDTYDDKARLTLGAAVSDVRTVQKLLETLYDDRMLRQTAIAQMRYSEKSLGTATSAFIELNPPPQRDRLTKRMSTLLGDAEDLLDEARTAIERYDRARYPALADDLDTIAKDLEELEGRVS